MLAIIQDTFRESFSKKTFIAFFAISNITILIFLFALNLDIVKGALAAATLFGQTIDLKNQQIDIRQFVVNVQSGIAVILYGLGIFLSIFATANLIPHMLEKGNIDLLLSKPLSRTKIFLAKYLGSLSIVTFNISYLVVIIWLILSFKTRIWNFGFLYSGALIIITFAIILSFMSLIGVMTRSSALVIMLAYSLFFLSQPLAASENIVKILTNKIYIFIIKALYWILPKTFELGNMIRLLVRNGRVENWLPLWTSLAFGGAMLFLANLYFLKKSY